MTLSRRRFTRKWSSPSSSLVNEWYSGIKNLLDSSAKIRFSGITNFAMAAPLVTAALKKGFGSVKGWSADSRNAARSCHGWAMMVWHPVNRKLYNVCTDSHDDGQACIGVSLFVVDLY